MRIAIYGINYAPELTGIGKYTGEMASWLGRQGHDVHVITAMPYYPEWQVHKKYRKRWWFTEKMDGVTVYRCPLYVPKKITPSKRIVHEFSFLLSVLPFWFRSFFRKKYDLVVCVTPPFHLGILPLIYSKIRGVALISHVQDLQVDAAKNLVMIKNSRLLNLMFGAERFILKRSTAVSTISQGMLRKIKEKNVPGGRTILFPNWVDANFIRPLPKEQSLRSEFGIPYEDKVILYSGNLGEKQGLNIILDVADHFLNKKNVHFLIVGSGGNKHMLEKQVAEKKLTNMKFFPLAEYEKLPSLLAVADLHLVLQKKSASDLVMPSKLTGILAAGGCPVVTADPDTTLYDVIDRNNMGILVKPECPDSLIKELDRALNTDLTDLRTNAREFAIRHLSRHFVMQKFEEEMYKMQTPGIEVIYQQVYLT